MDKIAPYQSIRLVAEACMLECPIRNNLPCGLCEYGSFCHALVGAFQEARKLGEKDKEIADIIDHEYEEKIKRQHQEKRCSNCQWCQTSDNPDDPEDALVCANGSCENCGRWLGTFSNPIEIENCDGFEEPL